MDKITEALTRRVEKIYPSKKDLEKVLRSGKKLRLYLGIDPTAPKLHLGHTVQLRKIQEFADLGHEVILLFGTGTVLVGDPSERDTGRELITQEEIERNIATWKKQVEPVIDLKKITIRQNGDWLVPLTLKDIIKIGSKISAIKLFKRDNFTRRIKAGDTVWYHETMYPLLQGYDSVALDVDLEVGGTDQTFNMLIGRELQRKINNKEKFVLANRMIMGTNGQPMSKTAGNCIWLTDSPGEMFGKIMSVQDQLIPDYFEFFTAVPMEEVQEIEKRLKKGSVNPMDLKKQLALAITSQFHGEQKAKKVQEEFERVFQKREQPAKLPSYQAIKKEYNIVDLLAETKLVKSRGEAKRLVAQGGVDIDQKRIKNYESRITIKNGMIIRAGKKRFIKICLD